MKSPWKSNQALDPNRTYVAVASTLQSRRLGATPAMFRGARVTAKQLRSTPGCVGFASAARPFRKNYRTISLWESEEALRAFVHAGAHGEVIRANGDEVESFRSVHWTVTGAEGRPTWREGARRLAEEPVTS